MEGDVRYGLFQRRKARRGLGMEPVRGQLLPNRLQVSTAKHQFKVVVAHCFFSFIKFPHVVQRVCDHRAFLFIFKNLSIQGCRPLTTLESLAGQIVSNNTLSGKL